MPLSATIEDIKAHQDKVEKNEIYPDSLPPCPRCDLDSNYFKIHAYRERRFLVIVKMLVKAVFCSLVRFRCPCCGKTITHYPWFAVPHKHYTRPTIEHFSESYVKNDLVSYEKATETDNGTPEYQNSGCMLSASTLHRWIAFLDDFYKIVNNEMCAEKFKIPRKKYKTRQRKTCLLNCHRLFAAEKNIFTGLAISFSSG